MDHLQSALTSIRTLRSNVGQVFISLSNGIRDEHGEENKENKYLLELQELLTTVSQNLREVEQNINSLTPQHPGIGNPGLLAQENTIERQALYEQVVNAYKWTDKVHEQSTYAYTLMSQNALKRSYMNAATRAKRAKSLQTNIHNVSPQQFDALVTQLDRMYNDMTFTIIRPYTTNAVVHVTLGNVLKAIIAFKGIMIERVVVKGYNENLDLWTESRYKVFRRVTDHMHASMLHFYNTNMAEISVKSFFSWFHSYVNLFSGSCKRCGLYLHSALPPTWRDQKCLEPYHYECKP